MSRQEVTYGGTSWEELHHSRRSDKLYALIEPIPGKQVRRILFRVTSLDKFSSHSVFFVKGTTPAGQVIELVGYCPQLPEQPCTFEVYKPSRRS